MFSGPFQNQPGRPQRPGRQPARPGRPWRGGGEEQPQAHYGSFRASLLYCPTCREATPARERLLLVLPSGNMYEYLCAQCGTSTGSKTDKEQSQEPPSLILP